MNSKYGSFRNLPAGAAGPLTAVLMMLALSAPVSAFAQDKCVFPESLRWILGSWKSTVGKTVFHEQWSETEGEDLEGKATAVSADGSEIFNSETMWLRKNDKSTVYVVQLESSEEPVTFRMIKCDAKHVLFENKTHDFPKRIEYRRAGPEAMSAHITDLKGNGIDLKFKRVSAR